MSDDFEDGKRRVKEKLKIFFEERCEGKASKFEPTEEQIKKAIISTAGCSLTPEEAQAEIDSTTADDYESWVIRALEDRIAGRCYLSRDGKIEHPTARLFSIGIESIEAGKSSSVFLELLKLIGECADEHDPLCKLFPNSITKQIKTANQQAKIVRDFKEYIDKNKKLSYKEIKASFIIKKESENPPVSVHEVRRALKVFGVNFAAKTGVKPELKPRKEGW